MTLCTSERKHLLGKVIDSKMSFSALGRVCEDIFLNEELAHRRCMVDSFVIMPNHIHALIMPGSSYSLSSVIRTLKAQISLEGRKRSCQGRIWQDSFHDHIVRDEWDLLRLREYIRDNPLKWELDRLNTGIVDPTSHRSAAL